MTQSEFTPTSTAATAAPDLAGAVAERYQQLSNQLRQLEQHYQRLPGSVKLLAVSKTHAADRLREAWAAGARDFGENYVQEALVKIAELSAPGTTTPGICWHFIGPVQSNKTRDIAEHFDWVHSVDRIKIARRLSEQRPAELPPLNICVQVNLSQEDSKSGVALADAAAMCDAIAKLPRLQLRGLMAIPAHCTDFDQQRLTFRPLAALFSQLQATHPGLDTLSIGMSDDYAAAIAEGSTMIRIGSAIFGARNPPSSPDANSSESNQSGH